MEGSYCTKILQISKKVIIFKKLSRNVLNENTYYCKITLDSIIYRRLTKKFEIFYREYLLKKFNEY